MKKTLLSVCLALTLLNPGFLWALSSAETGAPEGLDQWQAWVLFGHEEQYLCPRDKASGRHLCAWPVGLDLDLSASGGSFSALFELRREGFFPLPGGPGSWPEEVTDSEGRPVPVLDGSDQPRVWLPAGRHRLNGRFVWPELPESLSLPLGFVLNLKVDGRRLDFPAMESDYSAGRLRLWLRSRTAAPAAEAQSDAADSLKVTVNRLIQDSQPQMIKTRLKLAVSGKPREINIDNALLPETKATWLSSPLPAQLLDGVLRVRVRPGTYEIDLDSRSLGRSESLGPVPQGDWPEFWAFQAQDKLRLVEIEGAEQIDPSQADVYRPWRNFPVYLMLPGSSLKFNTIQRGDPEPAPDDLNLSRECWLDYQGDGLSCRDHLSGVLRRQWHLNVSPPFSLAQATLNGQPQVITWQTDSRGRQAPGLQLRNGNIDLRADLRLDGFDGRLPASGWDHELNARSQKINLPPGYRLFHVSGADVSQGAYHSRGSGTWTSAWGTLDFFIVLIIAIAAWKLFGPRCGFLALGTMVLCYHELMAPRMVFLHLLACAALLRLLIKPGKARFLVRSWRFLAALTLVVLAGLFFINQVRIALYPQLENPSLGYGSYNLINLPLMGASQNRYYQESDDIYYDEKILEAEPPAPETAQNMINQMMMAEAQDSDSFNGIAHPAPAVSLSKPKQAFDRSRAEGKSKDSSQEAAYANRMVRLSQSPDAKVQNSSPRPKWNWRSVYLNYNSSITAEQEVRLFFLSPALGRFLALIRIALMAALLLMVLKPVRPPKQPEKKSGGKAPGAAAPASAALALLLALLFPLFPGAAQAGENGYYRELLDEYRQRLLSPKADFSPGVPVMRLSASADSLEMEFEVEAAAEAVIGLPTLDKDFFRPESVTVDGRPLPLAEESGRWLALVPEGRSKVRLKGRLKKPAPKGFQINFHQSVRPRRTELAESMNWQVEGLEKDGQMVGPALYLSSEIEAQPDDGEAEESLQTLDPFFLVHRTISLGLEWEVHTSVRRLTPTGAPVSLRLPLLPGEKPLSAGFRRDDGKLTLNFGPQDSQLSWSSSLATEEELTLTAADGPWTESWSLDVSPIWRVAHQGPPPVQNLVGGYWQPQWQPWPGESLSLSVDRPQPVPGQYLVIDSAQADTTIGEQNRQTELNFQIRTSQGGPWSFALPRGAKVREFTVNGKNVPLTAGAGDAPQTLTASLTAGSHAVRAVWTEDLALGLVSATPALDLAVPTANIRASLTLPENRWILWTWGPVQGPAVQFWPLVAVLLLAACFLSRAATPLKAGGWFLLGLGLIQLNIFGAMAAAGWLLVLSRRKQATIKSPGWFNLWQIILVLWTIAALVLIYKGIQHGLLRNPDMLIEGGGSYGQKLSWFTDRSDGSWPVGRVFAVSLWYYKALMLAWSLWLAISLIKWLIWGWEAFSSEALWKKGPPRPMSEYQKRRAEALEARRQASLKTDEDRQS